jgi:hypothetical protein
MSAGEHELMSGVRAVSVGFWRLGGRDLHSFMCMERGQAVGSEIGIGKAAEKSILVLRFLSVTFLRTLWGEGETQDGRLSRVSGRFWLILGFTQSQSSRK